ncbi:cation:proton antiporter domain-containing protein [Methylomonas rapida]|uniref:Cation:proton antiporter n=1 Tax=Methylomonas rapida TaxID=2963939 RepID=A0ABY7GH93_9GAMM|nr:cation:proton antiporter [Methylomonas rapida]WAR43173.1 cation:proton antiporter [Methylomonas rapida]
MIFLVTFILTVFIYSLISRRLETTILTAPILFTLAGIALYRLPPAFSDPELKRQGFLLVAEIGLVMTLFTDAARINLKSLTSNRNLPIRLLTTGMLLTIFLGTLGGMWLFPSLSWQEAGILAAILAPTDAGLGMVIVNSPYVPNRIRQALNVEAGLNDGLSVPFLMCFIAMSLQTSESAGAVLSRFIGEQIGYGCLIGIGIGAIGGWLLTLATRKQWMNESMQQMGLVAIPLLCALASEASGASMFIAGYVSGFAVQLGFAEAGRNSVEFTDTWGQLFDFFVFFLFGLLVARSWAQFEWQHFYYAVFSLTLARMLPVALALLGSGLSRATWLFMGWFGPRGLASIVLGLVYLEGQAHLPGETTIKLALMMTVIISIFSHGLSALPGINHYAKIIRRLPADAAEYHD